MSQVNTENIEVSGFKIHVHIYNIEWENNRSRKCHLKKKKDEKRKRKHESLINNLLTALFKTMLSILGY